MPPPLYSTIVPLLLTFYNITNCLPFLPCYHHLSLPWMETHSTLYHPRQLGRIACQPSDSVGLKLPGIHTAITYLYLTPYTYLWSGHFIDSVTLVATPLYYTCYLTHTFPYLVFFLIPTFGSLYTLPSWHLFYNMTFCLQDMPCSTHTLLFVPSLCIHGGRDASPLLTRERTTLTLQCREHLCGSTSNLMVGMDATPPCLHSWLWNLAAPTSHSGGSYFGFHRSCTLLCVPATPSMWRRCAHTASFSHRHHACPPPYPVPVDVGVLPFDPIYFCLRYITACPYMGLFYLRLPCPIAIPSDVYYGAYGSCRAGSIPGSGFSCLPTSRHSAFSLPATCQRMHARAACRRVLRHAVRYPRLRAIRVVLRRTLPYCVVAACSATRHWFLPYYLYLLSRRHYKREATGRSAWTSITRLPATF